MGRTLALSIGIYVSVAVISIIIVIGSGTTRGYFFLGLILLGLLIVGFLVMKHWLEIAEIRTMQKRIAWAEARAYLNEQLQRWEQGDRSLDLMVTLSFTYCSLNQYEQAETYARMACDTLQVKTLWKHKSSYRLFADNAYMALGLACIYQGKFSEAAQEHSAYLPYAYATNSITAATCWANLLAGDIETATRIITLVKKPNRFIIERFLNPHMQFMVTYMQHHLRGEDTRTELVNMRHQYQAWIGELTRHKHPVFRARLYTILDTISPLLPLNWYYSPTMRLILGQAPDVIADYQTRREQGDQSPQTALVLATAHSHIGQGIPAEPLAREAFDGIVVHPQDPEFSGPDHNFAIDLTYVTLHDALMMQGRFDEAADLLVPRIPHSERSNLEYVFVVWDYYLAGNEDQARAMLKNVKSSQVGTARDVPHGYQLLAAYAQYKLGMVDSPERIIATQHYITYWDETIARLIDNPYRRALQDMVADIHAITESEQTTKDSA